MRVFVTGASGWIGSALVPDLIGRGHAVVGLARSDGSAQALAGAGAEVRRGSLDDLEVLRSAADAADGVIHLAYKHDIAFSGDPQGAADADRRAVETFGEVLAGSGRPLVVASGVLGLTPGRVASETDGLAGSTGEGRHGTAQFTLRLADRKVRSSIVRLPPTVHGEGDQGFINWMVRCAREAGRSAFIGSGTNRWPAVHRIDAARLFALALEKAPAGSALHAVADEGVPLCSIATVIGEQLDVPVVSIGADEARNHFGWLAGVVGVDGPASSAMTRELLDWRPMQPGLLDDLAAGHYFAQR